MTEANFQGWQNVSRCLWLSLSQRHVVGKPQEWTHSWNCPVLVITETSEGIVKTIVITWWLNIGHLSPRHLAACIEIWIVLRRLQIHQPSWYWLQGEQVLRAQPMIRFTLKCIYIGNQFQRRGPANEIALLPASAKLYPQEASGSFPDEHRLPGGMEMVLRLLWKVSGNH